MKIIIPPKLQPEDKIRIIAPARSLSIIGKEVQDIAQSRLQELGLTVTFGKHVHDNDDFLSSSVESRIDDLHEAFADQSVKAIFTVIGGFNSNQLLEYIDWDLIRNNPKIFCGYSDITVLQNAILTKTGLITYSGPHFSSFGQKLYFDFTLEYFKKCLMNDEPFSITPSQEWSDDQWYINQEKRDLIPSDAYWVLNEGKAEGTILGGNLGTFSLLYGTDYMSDIRSSILFLEDDNESQPHHLDRMLQSLLHQPGFSEVKGLVFGRFQKGSNITHSLLEKIVKTKKQLSRIPIIANVDFGHTDPKITFPIGGSVSLNTGDTHFILKILKH